MWPSFVINLAPNVERMRAVAAALDAEGIAFTRLEGVNGWQLSPSDLALHYDAARNRRQARRDLTRAEIGCYLSHRAAWQRITEGGAEGGFIFEDDISVIGDLAETLRLLSEDAGRQWDMVKLFSLRPIKRLGAARALSGNTRIGVPFEVPTCLNGYGLTREAARVLLGRGGRLFRPVDEDQKFFWETGLRVELVLPTPIGIGNQETTTGTVGGSRRLEKQGGPAQALRGLFYSIDYHARLTYFRARQGYKYD